MRRLKGCVLALVVLLVLCLLVCGILAETTTPLSVWLYHHNYYFQDVVDALHSHH